MEKECWGESNRKKGDKHLHNPDQPATRRRLIHPRRPFACTLHRGRRIQNNQHSNPLPQNENHPNSTSTIPSSTSKPGSQRSVLVTRTANTHNPSRVRVPHRGQIPMLPALGI